MWVLLCSCSTSWLSGQTTALVYIFRVAHHQELSPHHILTLTDIYDDFEKKLTYENKRILLSHPQADRDRDLPSEAPRRGEFG